MTTTQYPDAARRMAAIPYTWSKRDPALLAKVYDLTEHQVMQAIRLAQVAYVERRNRTKRRWSDDRQRRLRAMHTAYPHRSRPA